MIMIPNLCQNHVIRYDVLGGAPELKRRWLQSQLDMASNYKQLIPPSA